MNHKIAAPVPEAIMQLQRQLEQFRSNRPARTKLPESLWQAPVELARQHGIYAVANPLRLDYTRLRQRLGGNAEPSLGVRSKLGAYLGGGRYRVPSSGYIDRCQGLDEGFSMVGRRQSCDRW